MLAMLNGFKTASLLLATLLVARALVPLGYMLETAAGPDAGDLRLVFCPLQNPTLDVSLFSAGHETPAHHHHGGHDGGPADSTTLGALADCGQWLGSETVTPLVGVTHRLGLRLGGTAFGTVADSLPARFHQRTPFPRAPPGAS